MDATTGMTRPIQSMMTTRAVTILEDVSMAEARVIAVRNDYNGFPVVTPAGRLVGIVTKGDFLRAARAGLKDPEAWRQPVWRWMAHGVLALRPADTVEAAIALMTDSGFRSLPVIDEDARVIGMVSRQDLMATLDGGMRS